MDNVRVWVYDVFMDGLFRVLARAGGLPGSCNHRTSHRPRAVGVVFCSQGESRPGGPSHRVGGKNMENEDAGYFYEIPA